MTPEEILARLENASGKELFDIPTYQYVVSNVLSAFEEGGAQLDDELRGRIEKAVARACGRKAVKLLRDLGRMPGKTVPRGVLERMGSEDHHSQFPGAVRECVGAIRVLFGRAGKDADSEPLNTRIIKAECNANLKRANFVLDYLESADCLRAKEVSFTESGVRSLFKASGSAIDPELGGRISFAAHSARLRSVEYFLNRLETATDFIDSNTDRTHSVSAHVAEIGYLLRDAKVPVTAALDERIKSAAKGATWRGGEYLLTMYEGEEKVFSEGYRSALVYNVRHQFAVAGASTLPEAIEARITALGERPVTEQQPVYSRANIRTPTRGGSFRNYY